MEVAVIGCSYANVGRVTDTGLCSFSRNLNSIVRNNRSKGRSLLQSHTFIWPSGSSVGFGHRASASASASAVISEKAPKMARTMPIDSVKLYVGLPLDTVSSSNTINHGRAIAAGLKALKLLGVEGVELPLWWGIAEREAAGKYDWSTYLDVVEMIQQSGLKLHVSLCLHASEELKISLPRWVSHIGESDPSIYFTDRSGRQYKNCLSLSVDDIPVLDGKTPLEVYKAFCDDFKSVFSPFMGSTITGLTVGLGPDGELRFPSHHNPAQSNGAGEFQCYDRYMLADLKHHAETLGNPLWGLGGPHDTPGYEQSPFSGGFFTENGGSWETQYGDFFLSWYSSQLIRHGYRILSLVASTFKDVPITLSGKIPLMSSWCKLRSHPSELTAGYYNTDNREGYGEIAEIFSRNTCKMILPGMDLSDDDLPSESFSSPESLLAQIVSSCRKHGIGLAGRNMSEVGDPKHFEQMKKKLLGEDAVVQLFTYQRMGAYFFSPEHFPNFTKFVRSLYQQSFQSSDDFPEENEGNVETLSGRNLQMQVAA